MRLKELFWVASSRKSVREFPRVVQRSFGQALFAAQIGDKDPEAKPMTGFKGASVMEIVERYKSDAYRLVYTAQLDDAVYVLHAFKKKSTQGIATPKKEIALIRQRLAVAKRIAEEMDR